jgi:hypothetical protein
MTQLWGPTGFIKSYANARKLFQLGDLPIGVMTYGLGNIGNRSIEGVVRDFCRQLPEDRGVQAVTDALHTFVAPQYAAQFPGGAGTQALGFYVAGYSPDAVLAEEFEFIFPVDQAPRVVRPQDQLGISWRGIDAPAATLLRGISPGFRHALVAKGMPDSDLEQLSQQHGMSIALAGMPLQDAIDLATYVLDLTIGWARFQIGPDTCSRPLQVAAVLDEPRWQWLAKAPLAAQ